MTLRAIELQCCEMGTVSSRQDASVVFKIVTAELRPSEAGALMQYHGKAVRVVLFPHEGEPEEEIVVTTEKDRKTISQRIRAVLFILYKQDHPRKDISFEHYYEQRGEKILEHLKKQIEEQ